MSSLLQASIGQSSESHSQCLRLPSVVHCGQWTNCMPVHVELLLAMNSKCFLTLNILGWRQKRNCGWYFSAVSSDQWCCYHWADKFSLGRLTFFLSNNHFSELALHSDTFAIVCLLTDKKQPEAFFWSIQLFVCSSCSLTLLQSLSWVCCIFWLSQHKPFGKWTTIFEKI